MTELNDFQKELVDDGFVPESYSVLTTMVRHKNEHWIVRIEKWSDDWYSYKEFAYNKEKSIFKQMSVNGNEREIRLYNRFFRKDVESVPENFLSNF